MTEPITIGYGTNKWIKNPDTRMVTLVNNGAMPNGYASMVESGSGPYGSMTKYQVPAGKKFILLAWTSSVSHSTICYGPTPDVNVGNAINFVLAGWTSNGGGGPQECYIEIPAGNYITFYEYNQYPTMCIGVECDA